MSQVSRSINESVVWEVSMSQLPGAYESVVGELFMSQLSGEYFLSQLSVEYLCLSEEY